MHGRIGIDMTGEKEDKIIAQAQDILERRLGVNPELKVNFQNVLYYDSYLLGAQIAAKELIPYCMQNYRGDDKAYIKAELDMINQASVICNCGLTERRYAIATTKGTRKAN